MNKKLKDQYYVLKHNDSGYEIVKSGSKKWVTNEFKKIKNDYEHFYILCRAFEIKSRLIRCVNCGLTFEEEDVGYVFYDLCNDCYRNGDGRASNRLYRNNR